MSSHNGHPENIFFLVPYPFGVAPGQRFRYEQYLKHLKNKGTKIRIYAFLDNKIYSVLYKPGKSIAKLLAFIRGFVLRIALLPALSKADYVFIFREASPFGPPVFEWFIAKILRKKIIYDFDDAIWLTDRKNESIFLKIIKWRSKVSSVCRWSYKVSCGNEYLCDYAKRFAKDVIYNPTTIDTDALHNKDLYSVNKGSGVTIGWTGSHSTLKYLKAIEPVLLKIERKHPEVKFLVIADVNPTLNLKNLRFVPWSFTTEINDLLESDIGIMPLPDDEWTKGKCGFKALQYMALEIPAVVSRVGANAKIIDHGENGFLCTTHQEWIDSLLQLITNPSMREAFGRRSREKVVAQFSVQSNRQNFLNLFD